VTALLGVTVHVDTRGMRARADRIIALGTRWPVLVCLLNLRPVECLALRWCVRGARFTVTL